MVKGLIRVKCLKRLVIRVFKSFGFEIKKLKKNSQNSKKEPSFFLDFDHNLGLDLEQEANKTIKIIRKNTMTTYINLVMLYQQVVFCEKHLIIGDYVECGVWKGGSIGLMALGNMKYGKTRRNLHLFDSFEGICLPDDSKDGEKALREVNPFLMKNAKVNGKLEPIKGFYDSFGGNGTVQDNVMLLEENIKYPSDYIHYHKGWFQDTLPLIKTQIERIAILRLDGDWYSSTKICLENLYDKVVIGGFIIIDDYGCYEGCKRAVDEFIEARGLNVFLNYSNKDCRYWIKN